MGSNPGMNFLVIGAGAWGTAFAIHLVKQGHSVALAPRRFEHAVALATSLENSDYLPGIKLPPSIQVGHELTPLLMEAEVVLLACPLQSLRATCERVRDNLAQATRLRFLISLSKGLELRTHLRPSEIVASVLPAYAVGSLTGPTNAGEVSRGLPAAMVLGMTRVDASVASLQAELSGPSLRVYTSTDLPGVEFGGSLKNIYAIAAGCSDGLRLGDNAKAALMTRALAEMVRLGVALGAQRETFYGLSGFGDLVATCAGSWSRNRGFGEQLGRGRSAADLQSESRFVVEGYRTTESFYGLCRERGIDAPILTEVYRVLYENKTPAAALAALMSRDLKKE